LFSGSYISLSFFTLKFDEVSPGKLSWESVHASETLDISHVKQ
jgi:hypothetical protein